MNSIQALAAIISEARKEKGSVAGYKRAQRALRALGFNTEDALTVLVHLDYVNPDTREPYPWLAAKLASA
jgi:hypothetical protein